MDDKRGKEAGVTARTVARGAREVRAEAGAAGDVEVVLDVREAIRAAVRSAEPGDLVLIGCASHLSDLKVAIGADATLTTLDVAALPSTNRGTEAAELQLD